MKIKILIITTLLLLNTLVQAGEWTVSRNDFLNTYDVSDGEQNPIHYKTEKAAKKAAKLLNKNEKKNGFIDNGDCPEGVLC